VIAFSLGLPLVGKKMFYVYADQREAHGEALSPYAQYPYAQYTLGEQSGV
jgi:hypothetical protein